MIEFRCGCGGKIWQRRNFRQCHLIKASYAWQREPIEKRIVLTHPRFISSTNACAMYGKNLINWCAVMTQIIFSEAKNGNPQKIYLASWSWHVQSLSVALKTVLLSSYSFLRISWNLHNYRLLCCFGKMINYQLKPFPENSKHFFVKDRTVIGTLFTGAFVVVRT